MQYYIGIDGGATKTKLVLCDNQLNILIELNANSTSLTTQSNETVTNILFDLINRASKKIIDEEYSLYIGIGLAGAGRQTDVLTLKTSLTGLLKTRRISYDYLEITTDARIALEAAHAGKEGAILIAGTGSILFWKDANKKVHRLGGYGRIIGDEGSGYAIGLSAIQLLANYFDNRIQQNEFIDELINYLNINNTDSLITKIYKEDYEISKLAKFVVTKALNNDSFALSILKDNALALVELIKSFINITNSDIPIAFWGGLFNHNDIYLNMIKEIIKQKGLTLNIIEPKHSPEIGAVILVKN